MPKAHAHAVDTCCVRLDVFAGRCVGCFRRGVALVDEVHEVLQCVNVAHGASSVSL